jgi:hypothetical protein
MVPAGRAVAGQAAAVRVGRPVSSARTHTLKIGQSDRSSTLTTLRAARRWTGRRTLSAAEGLPDDVRDLLARAEKLVYLFPDGFDAGALVSDQTDPSHPPLFDFDTIIEAESTPSELATPPSAHTFIGRVGESQFAIEVREHSATIVADPFFVRRDLLLVIKDYAERRRREAAA